VEYHSKGGQVAHALGRINTLFQPYKNIFLRNLDQNVPKNVYFLEKAVKIITASGAQPPNPSWPSCSWGSAPRVLDLRIVTHAKYLQHFCRVRF